MKKKLADRFDRYAILHIWNFQNPAACTFHVERHGAVGGAIPAAVEKPIRKTFFAPEDFEPFILDSATRGATVKPVLALLRGEPLQGKEAVPYGGEPETYEDLLGLAAQDKIALNVGGTWYCREAGETEEESHQRLRQKAWRTGRDLHQIKLGLPSQVGGGGIAVTPPVATPPTSQVFTPLGPVVGTPPVPPYVTQPTTQTPPPPMTPVASANPVILQSLGAKTGINLLGDLETWALTDKQRVPQASLTIRDLSIKELRDLCTRLPPKIRAELQITLPPEGGQNP